MQQSFALNADRTLGYLRRNGEAAALPPLWPGLERPDHQQMEQEMTDPAQIADRYIAVWNETDPARRRTLLADGWTKNATYVDPLAAGEGHEQIGALIGASRSASQAFASRSAAASMGMETISAFHGRSARKMNPT
jgi:hypothetical protein